MFGRGGGSRFPVEWRSQSLKLGQPEVPPNPGQQEQSVNIALRARARERPSRHEPVRKKPEGAASSPSLARFPWAAKALPAACWGGGPADCRVVNPV